MKEPFKQICHDCPYIDIVKGSKEVLVSLLDDMQIAEELLCKYGAIKEYKQILKDREDRLYGWVKVDRMVCNG